VWLPAPTAIAPWPNPVLPRASPLRVVAWVSHVFPRPSPAQTALEKTDSDVSQAQAGFAFFAMSRNGDSRSMGMGKTMVEVFSPAIPVSVCR
jgi:hypothetical protein